jgi:hypothetical protein
MRSTKLNPFQIQLAFIEERVQFVFRGGYGPLIEANSSEVTKPEEATVREPLVVPFVPYRKIPRLFRDCIITEKIDGTNACVHIVDLPDHEVMPTDTPIVAVRGTGNVGHQTRLIYAGSRTRWITPGKSTDNYGFAKFVEENADELAHLGPGTHHGEWWGGGIQRGYGMPGSVRHFSLFNVHRFADPTKRPKCCDVVPTLWTGTFSTGVINQIIDDLRVNGSQVMPGFMNPEGIVAFHTQGGVMFKATLENDEKPKGSKEQA